MRARNIMLGFAATIHILAAVLCFAPSKYHKSIVKWQKAAKSIVNMDKHRKRKCKHQPLFEI